MLRTYHAELQANGVLRFLEPMPSHEQVARRVLVTFTEPLEPANAASSNTWQSFAGALADSPNLKGDPLVIQQDMRHEWK